MQDDYHKFLSLKPEVPRETMMRLKAYVDLIVHWNASHNLMSNGDLERIWTRHIADSIGLYRTAPDGRNWLDLGSGAGLPACVLAILLKSTSDARVVAVEKTQKKAVFLALVASELKLPLVVLATRIEEIDLEHDVVANLGTNYSVSARGLASLAKLFELCERFFGSEVDGYFQKGAELDAELERASEWWQFESELTRNILSHGEILRVTALKRRH